MARCRRFSTISFDEAEGCRNKTKYIPETEALRSVGKNVHPDDYPCFLLENTTVYLQDGKTTANLLNAELQGPFVVRGRLVVDGDLNDRLFSKKSNGQYIEVARCESFSIGDNPVTLWALGQSGWLEIQPSETYQSFYRKMTEAISIFYFVTDFYEKHRRKKGSKYSNLSIDTILLQYAIHEGTGLVRSEVADKIKTHAQFLLSQMRKVNFGWQTTQLFKWLSAECYDVYNKLLNRTGETVLPASSIALAELVTPISQAVSTPQLQETNKMKPQIPRNRTWTPDPSSTRSTPNPTLLLDTCDPLTAILSLLRAPRLDIRGWSPIPRMTFSKLGTLFYYAYTIRSEPVSQEIIRLHSPSIVSSLGPEWKEAPVYAQLKEAVSNTGPMTEIKKIAMSITEVKRRINKTVGSRYVAPSTRHSERQDAHGSKSVFPPQSGRRSGKEAGLRLAPSQAMKRVEKAESEEDDGSRPKKRRRPSPPEMGEESEYDSLPSALALVSSEGYSDDDIEEDDLLTDTGPILTLKMVTEALPTLSPSGPNGAWKCDHEDCVLVVREAESEEGKERMRKHFGEHAELLERESLARQEAAQRRVPIEHLLEKLRSLGEKSRLGGSSDAIGGRVVPEPIKRERGMAV